MASIATAELGRGSCAGRLSDGHCDVLIMLVDDGNVAVGVLGWEVSDTSVDTCAMIESPSCWPRMLCVLDIAEDVGSCERMELIVPCGDDWMNCVWEMFMLLGWVPFMNDAGCVPEFRVYDGTYPALLDTVD